MTASAPHLQGLLEASVYVDDLDRAAAFYGDLLGLEIITRQEGRHVFFRCGGAVLLAFIAEAAQEPPPEGSLPVPPHGATGPGHVCFAAETAEIDLLVAMFERDGVGIEADFRWPHGPRSIYVRDPAGNSIEFAEPNLWDAPS